jgi:hypothetical protein
MASGRILRIPTGPAEDAEIVEVPSDELPLDSGEVLEVIREVTTEEWTPPLAIYADLAIEYLRLGLHPEAEKVLRAGLDPSECRSWGNRTRFLLSFCTPHSCHHDQSWRSSS